MKKSFFKSSMFICLVCTMLFLTLTLLSFASSAHIVLSVFYTGATLTMACMLPSCSTNQ